jgi:hypothetical protein
MIPTALVGFIVFSNELAGVCPIPISDPEGAVAKWLRQRIANPPSWVRLPPAPLLAGNHIKFPAFFISWQH